MAIKSTDFKDISVYFCEKHQRNHKKGSKVYDECFSDYVHGVSSKASRKMEGEALAYLAGATPPAPISPTARPGRHLAVTSPLPSRERDGVGKAGVVAKKWDDPSIASDSWLKGNKEDILKDLDAAHKKVSEYGRLSTSEVSEKTKAEFNKAVKAAHDTNVGFEEKVANYRAERWEFFKVTPVREPRVATGSFAYFSPAEMLQFAREIAIAQGKKWHWWNENKRRKECKKAGVDPEYVRIGDI